MATIASPISRSLEPPRSKPFRVVVFLAEKARAQFSVGGEPDARTMPAEGLRHRRDQSNFAGAIHEAVLPRGFAALVHHRNQRPARRDAAMDFRGGHHHVAGPRTVRIQRHEFDETHHDFFFAREFSEGFHFVVVQPAHQHRVHFHGTQPRSLRGLDSRHHIDRTSSCASPARIFRGPANRG